MLHCLKSFHRSATNDISIHLTGQNCVMGSPYLQRKLEKWSVNWARCCPIQNYSFISLKKKERIEAGKATTSADQTPQTYALQELLKQRFLA